MEKKIIYYNDELNDEFSEAQIIPRVIDENYKYVHKNPFWNLCSILIQNFFSVPVKFFYSKLKFRIKYVGKENLKPYKNQGYFVYVNHTQPFADTLIPSRPVFPKRNFFIVNPENVSMKGMKTLVELFGAIPVPGNIKAMKNFLECVKLRSKKSCITIYPEAHIWPYYTKIRPFKDVSFEYPIKYNKPTFCMTNTYQKYKGKFRIVTYIDGPFFADDNLGLKDAKQNLRNKVYNQMVERSKVSDYEYIKYIKEEN